VDITIMSVLLVGASNHLERQDGTIRTMLVLPVSMTEILSAKVLASMVLGLQSAAVASAALFLIHGISYNYAWLLLFVLLSGVAHAAIGFFLTLHSKDFSTMLLLLMAYMMLFNVPSILFFFDVLDARYDWILMISPSHVSNTLIGSCVSGSYDWGKTAAGCAWLAVLSAILLRFAVYPRFRKNAVRG
jgi:fluoroquinolone transport system permease protein